MRLFLYLLLGHLIGDFVLQPAGLVRLKRSHAYGVYPHVLLVVLPTAVLIAGSVPHAWLIIALVTAVHLLIDRLSILAFSRTPIPQFYILLADQAAHIVAVAGMAWAVVVYGGQTIGRSWLLPIDDWTLALLCGVIMVSFGGAVFLFEAGELVSPTAPSAAEGALLGYSLNRFVGMFERATFYLAAVFGAYLIAGLLVAGRGVWTATRPAGRRQRAVAELAATLGVVVVLAAVTVAGRPVLTGGG